MTRPAADLQQRIAAYCDGRMDADQVAAFESELRADTDALDALIDYAEVHAHLRWLNTARASATPGTPAPHADAEPAPGEASGTTPIPIYRKGCEPQPPRFRPHHFAVAGIAAALLATCGLAIYAYFSSLPQSEFPDPTSAPPIATLIASSSTVIYEHDIANEGNEYAAGEYSIESGSAQFLLKNFVTVDLDGPTQLLMHNPMHATFRTGSATFKCPPGTEGFKVDLPGEARIVDLGTRFRITDRDGRIEVKVLDGRVSIDRASNDPVTLATGQIAVVPTELAKPIAVSTVIADVARDWIDASTLPDGWRYLQSDAAHGGTESSLMPDASIGDAGNDGFGGPYNDDYNLSAVLGWDIDDDAQYEIFVDGFEGNAAIAGKDLLVHPGGAPVGYVILRYTVTEDDVASNTAATIAGSFRNLISSGGDTVSVSVLHNGEPRFAINGNTGGTGGTDGEPGMLSQADGSFEFDTALAAGDTIDFVVSNNTNINADETAIRATITLAPAQAQPVSHENIKEPASSPPVTAEPEE